MLSRGISSSTSSRELGWPISERKDQVRQSHYCKWEPSACRVLRCYLALRGLHGIIPPPFLRELKRSLLGTIRSLGPKSPYLSQVLRANRSFTTEQTSQRAKNDCVSLAERIFIVKSKCQEYQVFRETKPIEA